MTWSTGHFADGVTHHVKDDKVTLCGLKPRSRYHRTSAGLDCPECIEERVARGVLH